MQQVEGEGDLPEPGHRPVAEGREPAVPVGDRGGGDQQRDRHHGGDPLRVQVGHPAGGDVAGHQEQARPHHADVAPAAGAHREGDQDAEREVQQPHRREHVGEPVLHHRGVVAAGDARGVGQHQVGQRRGGDDGGDGAADPDEQPLRPDPPQRPVQQREGEVEDQLGAERPARRVDAEVGVEVGYPDLQHQQVQDGRADRGVGAREEDHGQRPGDHVVRDDLDHPAPPEAGGGVARAGRPGEHEAAEHEEERHPEAAGLVGEVDEAELGAVVGEEPQGRDRQGGVVREDRKGGGEAQAGQGRQTTGGGLRRPRSAPAGGSRSRLGEESVGGHVVPSLGVERWVGPVAGRPDPEAK